MHRSDVASPRPSALLFANARQEGRDAQIKQFQSFDARQAVCFLQEDTDRLQNTIEGGFGSLSAFSSSVTDVLESVANERATKESV